MTFLIERGPEARFGRISVSGNVTTRDKIVRRELTFSEGDVFNSDALRRSRQKVTNLGFFETVDLVPRPSGDNIIDVDIEIKERLTGAITFGVGYSSEDKLTGQLRVSENNLFGRGHSLALTFEKSPVRANYSLSFTEPSVLDTPWSAGFSIYNTEREYDEYDRKSVGGSLTFGRSLGEYLRSYVRLKHETVTVEQHHGRRRDLPARAGGHGDDEQRAPDVRARHPRQLHEPHARQPHLGRGRVRGRLPRRRQLLHEIRDSSTASTRRCSGAWWG